MTELKMANRVASTRHIARFKHFRVGKGSTVLLIVRNMTEHSETAFLMDHQEATRLADLPGVDWNEVENLLCDGVELYDAVSRATTVQH